MPLPEKIACRIKVTLPDADWRNEADRPRQYNRMFSRMAKLIEAAKTHIGEAAKATADSDGGDDEDKTDDREQA